MRVCVCVCVCHTNLNVLRSPGYTNPVHTGYMFSHVQTAHESCACSYSSFTVQLTYLYTIDHISRHARHDIRLDGTSGTGAEADGDAKMDDEEEVMSDMSADPQDDAADLEL